MKKFVLPFLLAVWPFFSLAEGGVVISQVQTEGDGGVGDEFVEINNNTNSCVSLGGWSLQYKSSAGDFPPGAKKVLPEVELPPHAYYLVANSQYNGTVRADLVHSSFSLSGAAAGATIFLANTSQGVLGTEDATLVDRFAYGNSASNTPLGAAPLVPIEAEKPAVDWAYSRTGVSGNNAVDFAVLPASPQNFLDFTGSLCSQASTTPALEATSTEETLASTTPSTETATSTAKNANIKIYRFLPDPAGDDSGNEWVELKNNDSQDVDLSGWLLDDKNTGSGPKTGALALSGTIVAGEVKRVIIPVSHFTLNNSGGDEVNLYFADKTLADSAVYNSSAYSGGVFEFRNGLWQPPVLSSSGGVSGGSAQASIYSAPAVFRLNEVFPNFTGEDAGNEWVEIYNSAPSTSSLEGLFLDVGTTDSWTSGAYKLPKTLVPAGSMVQVVLPKNSITLKNSGKEKIKLFSPDRELIDFVEYEDAPESLSWQKNAAGKWEWGLPTPGEANNVPDVPPIIFSEVLPSPEADQDEFVELYNLATTTVGLEGFTLGIGSRTKIFLKDEEIQPESYRVLFADDLPVALRNSGQELFLKDKWGRIVSTLRYPAAQKGLAYASLDGKEFIWTSSVTPGGPNQMVLAGNLKNEPVLTTASVPTVKKTIAAPSKNLASDAILASLSQQNQEQGARLAALQTAVENLSRQLEEKESGQTENSSAAPGLPGLRYLVLAFACGFFLFWLYKFLPRNPSPGQPA